MRLIPGKTKVHVELFRGVTIGDVIVCGIAMAMLVLLLVSNLPWKLGITIAIAVVTALLLLRLDEQPTYVYFLHILSFFGFRRHFARNYKDHMLLEAGEGRVKDAAFDRLFNEEVDTPENRKQTKQQAREKDQQQRAEKKAARAAEKAEADAQAAARQ